MAIEIEFRAANMQTGEGAVLAQAMRDEIAEMYDGLNLDGPDMPKAGPQELSPPRGTFIVGWSGEAPVCCGGVKGLVDGACEIKKMFVAPEVRGQGVARTLLGALEDEARRLGYSIARLDTGPRQANAQGLYESAGYQAVENFNGNPVATFFGEKKL